MTTHNLIIQNGRVIDPHNKVDEVVDVVIENGRVLKLGTSSDSVKFDGWPSVDASGCVVTPGLIDCHVHAYEHATPLGINVDRSCLARGVTAVVDAGSAGSGTFPGIRKFVKDQSKTRVYCLLHIAQHGLAAAGCVAPGGGGEIDSLNVVQVGDCVSTIDDNRDMVVGIKLRLAKDISDKGKNEQEAYRRSLDASKKARVPLMVHHAMSTVPLRGEKGGLGCPGDLQAGDLYTHCFHGHGNGIVNTETGKVDQVCWEAKKRGVLFDVGHGRGSFSWRIAETCCGEGFWPDIISTDLHTQCNEGPSYDLPCTMSRFLHLGMELTDIVAATTCVPAKAIGKLSEIGHLGVGMPGDVTVLRVEDVKGEVGGGEELEDVEGEVRLLSRVIQPVHVVREGELCQVLEERPWPKPGVREQMAELYKNYK